MNSHWSKYAVVRDLEAAMGGTHEDNLFSYAARVQQDEEECYPFDALQWLDLWGMQQHYVPASLGGALDDFGVLFSLVRAISRRDLTVAVSHAVSFLGSVAVWIAGSQKQKEQLAAQLLQGKRISLALTEREHGGDLLGIETSAHLHKAGKRLLDGEKWLINGASRNPLISVLARTATNGGPRGFSLFLFDKLTATLGSFECLEKVRTLGVRGSDISGIRFHQALLNPSAMVGAEGEGFEIVLKGLQLSRLLCGAISRGAAETAFQVTLDFALKRRLYGGTVFKIPQCRRLLVQAWVDLLICDSLLASAVRGLHLFPSQASVHSAVIKYLVPHLLEETLKKLSVVLGARYYLRQEHHSGIFQKIMRDHSLISLFDGSSVVNLYFLTTQFKAFARSWRNKRNGSGIGSDFGIWNLDTPLPEFDWSRLSLSCGGQNCFVDALPDSLDALRSLTGSASFGGDLALALRHQADVLKTSADSLMTEIGYVNLGVPHAVDSDGFHKAGSYCALAGAAMTLQMWLANRLYSQEPLAAAQWLVLALARLNACLGHETNLGDSFFENASSQLLQKHAENESPWTESSTLCPAELQMGSTNIMRNNNAY